MKPLAVLLAIAALAVINVAAAHAKQGSSSTTARSLADARIGYGAEELLAQQTHSQHVLTFFRRHRHHWMVASQHRTCTSVPWARTCRIARGQVRLHRWLDHLATVRYQRIMFSPAVVRAWVLRYHPCLDQIIQLEDRTYDPTISYGGGHGNVDAPYGLPQANPGYKMASAGADWRTNPYTQLRWMIGYAIAKFGSECAAAYSRVHSQSY